MKRRWNTAIWAGFLIVVLALVAYPTVFVRFSATRDVPWATVLLFGTGLLLLGHGLRRAFREPQLYRGRIAGPVLMVLGLALVGFFLYSAYVIARQLPAAEGAPRIGQRVPEFTLPDKDGHPVSLTELLGTGAAAAGRANGVLLIFYRGYW